MKTFALSFLLLAVFTVEAQKKNSLPEIGVVQSIENDSLLNSIGYRGLVESVGKMVSPRTINEDQFQNNLKRISNSKVPIYAFNIFIPGELKVVGPAVDEQAVLKYVEEVFKRARQANVKRII